MKATRIAQRIEQGAVALGVATLTGCFTLSDSPISESTAPLQVRTSRSPAVTGEHEIVVTFRDVGSTSAAPIYRAAYARASKLCDDFVVLRDTYRAGDDSTSAFRGIAGPWVELHIRCASARQGSVKGSAALLVETASEDFQDSAFFDIHAENLPRSYDEVFDAVLNVLQAQGDPAYRPDREKGLILTGRARHGVLGFPIYEQYVIAFDEDNATSTKISFKLLVYVPDLNTVTSARLDMTPAERKFVYRRAAAFLDRLRAALKR